MRLLILVLLSLIPLTSTAQQAPTTREMNLLGWQEFAELVPSRTETVLIPTGTLEAHGVLPNGADNISPEAMARDIADGLNALIAPTLNYGVTGTLDAFPGTFSIDSETYEAFVAAILSGLAQNGFRNLIILNGHGGPQTEILERVAESVGREQRVRTLVTNWWAIAADITLDVFGDQGGHAGNNETGYVQAIVPEHVHPDRYDPSMASARGNGWKAYPFPSSIVLYEEGDGYPKFDQQQADEYFRRVNARMTELISTTVERWDRARLYR